MTALTHQLTSRTLAATALVVAALAGLIAALALAITVASGHSPTGQIGRPASVSRGSTSAVVQTAPGKIAAINSYGAPPPPAPRTDFGQPGCLVCYR